MTSDEPPIFCNRCLTHLTPGEGDFHVVRIEAFADPTPPGFSDEDLETDARQEIEKLIAAMENMSEREAMDQVHRRLTIYMCGPCYRQWIEDPTANRLGG